MAQDNTNQFNAVSALLSADYQKDVDAGFQKMQKILMDAGFSTEAVNAMTVNVIESKIPFSDEEKNKHPSIPADAAWIVWTVKISAPGSLSEMISDEVPDLSLLARQQVKLIIVEVGANLMPEVKRIIEEVYGLKLSGNSTQGDARMSERDGCIHVESKTCHPLNVYFRALNALVEANIGFIAPKSTASLGAHPFDPKV